MTVPAISIIIPVYNKAAYLKDCLFSVLGQTFTDFELILVDDCSTDESRDICEDFAFQDPRVRFLPLEKNLGASGARNQGLAAAKGGYISFIDADDRVEPNLLERLYGAMNRERAGIAVCGYCYEAPDGKRLGSFSNPDRETLYEGEACLSQLVQLYPVRTRFDIALWNKLFSRDLLSGIFLEDFCSEDYLFNIQAFARAERVVHIPDILYRAVQSPDSFSRAAVNRKNITAIQANRIALERISKLRPDLIPAALERLICICAQLSLDAKKNCAMPYRDARKVILSNGLWATKQAMKLPGSRAALALRRQWINLFFPGMHGIVDTLYRRFFIEK